jgi:hypothetical protein
VKDADYASGNTLTYIPVDENFDPIADPDASKLTNVETAYVQIGNKLYIYTAVDATAGAVTYYVGDIIFTVDAAGVVTGEGAASAAAAAGTGFVHEVVVTLASDATVTLTADVIGAGEYDYYGE